MEYTESISDDRSEGGSGETSETLGLPIETPQPETSAFPPKDAGGLRNTRRGASVRIPIERKTAALAAKDAGGSYKDAAKLLYNTPYPTAQQVKNASKHIAGLRASRKSS